ncbi:hypothetical protein LSS_06400 [Leptospira santarosai serovar Shermani str. LT 821]|uniref:Uncharacterized protein n=1 Tax=Leptospira santarosai serovar Shermani str. LT 821 TaxID=758847 RepID=K8YE14_9LEPT|nr:hypothetical protein LSS_06400 [Leptospira santarosai serovar Shermani str. LT 821]
MSNGGSLRILYRVCPKTKIRKMWELPRKSNNDPMFQKDIKPER